ncbi:hypothetical protein FCH28_28540 [Streptomyces piniterrae]|uniref:Uncharacterized protein n=1 Tax=Streptomyces piniterrae TaxID=2571125 RepID=A0A4V5MIG7_9ACTN|nr:hypothetical protein [Streptomyces piniterrae]TJZ45298.1 hypothetical protein FCH28_28540 [Streptomyces piniterrae]
MTPHDAVTAVERSLDDLVRSVGRLENLVGSGLEVRRMRSDTDHLRESLGLLKESVAAAPPGRLTPGNGGEAMVPVPDTPYDSKLWTDVDEEGLGARGRRAP